MTRKRIPFTRKARTISGRAEELRRLQTTKALAAEQGRRVIVRKGASR